MKLLFLTPQLPHPPRQGTALRNWGLISHLAARGHAVVLLSFDEDGAEPSPELRAACARIVRVPVPRRSVSERLRTMATSALPDMAWRLWSPAFRDALHQLMREERPDILQIEGIELARYALEPGGAQLPRVIFDDHNCEYLFQKRAFDTDIRRPRRWHAAAYSFVQWQRLRDFECRALRRADAVLAVSEQDQALLRALLPQADVQVIYNGIDVEAYGESRVPSLESRVPSPESRVGAAGQARVAPLGTRDSGLGTRDSKLGTPRLVFTGKMDFRPNIDAALWFGQQVLPLIAAAVPEVTVSIVGQKPGPRLDVLRADPRITITGAVEDIKPHIASADVYIAPLLAGGGTRFKLLEAMAMRKAIVSTTLGAEGFAVTSGREMALADTPQAFAQAVIDLLNDAGRRVAMGDLAHAFVSATYDWRAIVPKLEAIYARDH